MRTTLICLTILKAVQSKSQTIHDMHEVAVIDISDLDLNKGTQIDFSSTYLDEATLAAELNAAKKIQPAAHSTENEGSLAEVLSSYIGQYEEYEQNRQHSGDVIFDKAGADAKLQQDKQKRLQLIKNIIAVAIYFIISIGLVTVLCIVGRRYIGNGPIMAGGKTEVDVD